MFSMIHRRFISSYDLTDIYLARAYINSRMKDAVACYRNNHLKVQFQSPIDLAQFLARYW